MAVAGVETEGSASTSAQATTAGIQRTVDVATKAIGGNYFGPLIAAVTFVRVLLNIVFQQLLNVYVT